MTNFTCTKVVFLTLVVPSVGLHRQGIFLRSLSSNAEVSTDEIENSTAMLSLHSTVVEQVSLHSLAASRQALEGKDPRPVCRDPFDPCWDGTAWKVTPTCSGAPGTWEAVLFSDGLGKICQVGGAGPPEGLRCSKLGGICHARKLLLNRGCESDTMLKALYSEDSVSIKTPSGHYINADGSTVQVRPSRLGGIGQVFQLQRLAGSGVLSSGDSVVIKAPAGFFLSAQDGGVQATHEDDGNSTLREFILQKKGGGTLFSSDVISLKAAGSLFISVKGHQLFADTNETRVHQQDFTIEKELNGTSSTVLNFGRNCHKAPPSAREVFSDSSIFLRASTGNLVDVSEDVAHARWPDYGGWQKFSVEKEEGGIVESGNIVFLKTHEGNHMDAEDAQVRARFSEHGDKQAIKITKDIVGPIHYGDSVFLETSGGKHISVEDERVSNSNKTKTASQRFVVEKGRWTETVRFMHIPRNAGMAIEDAALQHDIHWGRWLMTDMMRMPGGGWCSLHHAPPSTMPGWGQAFYRDFENFCVTRHPYDRAVSQYSYMLSQIQGNDTLAHSHPSLFKYEACSTDGLNHYLQTQLGRVLHDDRKYIDNCNFVPQSAYIWDEKRQWCSHILRMDELPGNFNMLMDEKDYTVRLSANASNITNSHKDLCPDLTAASLSKKTQAQLDEVYAADFRRLGYKEGRK